MRALLLAKFRLDEVLFLAFDVIHHDARGHRARRHSLDPTYFIGDDELVRVALGVVVCKCLRHAALWRTLHVPPAVKADGDAAAPADHIVCVVASSTGPHIFWAAESHRLTVRYTKYAPPFPIVLAELGRLG